MMVYIIDTRVPRAPPPNSLDALMRHDNDTLEQGWRRVIDAFPGHSDAQIIMVQENMSINDTINAVIEKVQTTRTIWMLRIVAHGYQGSIDLGQRLNIDDVRHFRLLVNYMTPDGRGVEIHSCKVARYRRGRRLLQRMADMIRMPVKAALESQSADNRFRFEGATVMLEPRQRLSTPRN